MTSMYKEKRYLICVSLILGVQIGYNVVHLRTSLVQLFLPPLHSWSNGWPCKILLVMFKCIVQHDVVVRTVYFDQPVDFYATTACFCFFELHGISETLTTHAQSSIWTHTQTLPLGASSKIEPTNPQNWRSHHRSLCCRRERLLPLKAQTSLNLENFTPRGVGLAKGGEEPQELWGSRFLQLPPAEVRQSRGSRGALRAEPFSETIWQGSLLRVWSRAGRNPAKRTLVVIIWISWLGPLWVVTIIWIHYSRWVVTIMIWIHYSGEMSVMGS
jgi:hypothetical protein